MLKVDSGPGRLNSELLALIRFHGFYMYPSVPNTTAVSQETDQNYGPFKKGFHSNLKEVTDARIKLGLLVSFAPWIVGLIIFSGVDPVSSYKLRRNAFEVSFDTDSNLHAWTCLHDKQVRQEVGDNIDGMNRQFVEVP